MHPLKRSGIVLLAVLLVAGSACAQHSRLKDASDDCIFSPEFMKDYAEAQKRVDEMKSVDPLLVLLERYTKPEEQAELELSIGLAYSQRTGVVDPANAVVHFCRALRYELPEQTCIEIYQWRGGSHEQLKQYSEAMRDYLRGLLACSYLDMSGGWPALKEPNVPIYANSNDPENTGRVRDYRRYREAIERKRFALRTRYYLVRAVRYIQEVGSIGDDTRRQMLKNLTPDTSRYDLIDAWMVSENEQPWP